MTNIDLLGCFWVPMTLWQNTTSYDISVFCIMSCQSSSSPADGRFVVLGSTLYAGFLIALKIILHNVSCFQIQCHPLSLDVPKGLADFDNNIIFQTMS